MKRRVTEDCAPKKAVVSDFDGTFSPKGFAILNRVDNHALTDSAKAAADSLRALYEDRVHDGTAAPDDEMVWLRQALDIYVKDRIALADVARAIDGIPLRPGTHGMLTMLHDCEIPVAIVTYGVALFVRMTLVRHGIDHLVDHVYGAEVHVNNGTVVGYDPDTLVVPANKGKHSRAFAAAKNVRREHILAVGDTPGDRHLGHCKANRIGIAADKKDAERLAPHMGHVVITEHFAPVTNWLLTKIRPC